MAGVNYKISVSARLGNFEFLEPAPFLYQPIYFSAEKGVGVRI
jgi:hypothetical protein